MLECPKCNKKFRAQKALIQHLNDKKDENHRLLNKKDENHSENCSESLFSNELQDLYVIVRLSNKPNLTENQKNKLDKAKEFLKEERKRRNIKLGLPEDAPPDISLRIINEKLMKKRAETEELKRKNRELNREIREIDKETKRKIEQWKIDAWKEHDKSAKEFKDKNPQIKDWAEKIPIKPEENIECAPCKCPACPPPLKNRAKKNKLLDMVTG